MSSQFKQGSGAYRCNDCGKLTRETGHGESDCELCAFCFRTSMLENGYNDGHISEAEYQRNMDALKKEYKR